MMVILGPVFYVVWVFLGNVFMTIDAMGAGLTFNGFSGMSGGSPELRARASGRVAGVLQGQGCQEGPLS